jgi:hypothetical protein
MLLALESEGLQEALQRRWLVPDMSNGYLLVSQDMSKVQEMRQVAAEAKEEEEKSNDEDKDEADKDKDGKPKKKEWTKPWEQPNESRNVTLQHSQRPLSELLSPGTGHDSGGSLSAATPTTPTRPPSTASVPSPAAPMPKVPAPAQAIQPPGSPSKAGVGDDVMVAGQQAGASGNQTFTGKVTSTANGKLKINFGGRDEREYSENEVKLINRAGAPGPFRT